MPRFEAAVGGSGQTAEPGGASAALSEAQRRVLMSRLRLAVLASSPNFAVPDEATKVPGAALVAKAAAGGFDDQDEAIDQGLPSEAAGTGPGPLLVGRDLGLSAASIDIKRHRAERDLVAERHRGGDAARLVASVHGIVPRTAQTNSKRAPDRLRTVERAVLTITDASNSRVVLREVPTQLCLVAWSQPGMPSS